MEYSLKIQKIIRIFVYCTLSYTVLQCTRSHNNVQFKVLPNLRISKDSIKGEVKDPQFEKPGKYIFENDLEARFEDIKDGLVFHIAKFRPAFGGNSIHFFVPYSKMPETEKIAVVLKQWADFGAYEEGLSREVFAEGGTVEISSVSPRLGVMHIRFQINFTIGSIGGEFRAKPAGALE